MRTASQYAWIAMVVLFWILVILLCTAITILLVWSSDAHALFETRDAKLQQVRTIGIVSAIGDQFTFAKAASPVSTTRPDACRSPRGVSMI